MKSTLVLKSLSLSFIFGIIFSVNSIASPTIESKKYALFSGTGELTDRADLEIYRDANQNISSVTLELKKWMEDTFIYDTSVNYLIGRELIVIPTPFPGFDEWKTTCSTERPSKYCDEARYERDREQHYLPERWRYTVVDVANGRPGAPFETVNSEVATETGLAQLPITSSTERGGYKRYQSEWVEVVNRAFANNRIDSNKLINESQLRVKIDYQENAISSILRVNFQFKGAGEDQWFLNPFGPLVFCHNCSSF